MTAVITELPPRGANTVTEAFDGAAACGLREVLIVGYDSDGEWRSFSSGMSRRDALWLAEKMREYALNGNT